MNKSQQFLEKYMATVKVYNNQVEIFKNPTTRELDSLNTRAIRYFADPRDDTVYAWDGNLSTHYNMKENPEIARLLKNDSWLLIMFSGHAVKSGGKYIAKGSDSYTPLLYSDKKVLASMKVFLERDWSWVDKYIEGTSDLTKDIAKEL